MFANRCSVLPVLLSAPSYLPPQIVEIGPVLTTALCTLKCYHTYTIQELLPIDICFFLFYWGIFFLGQQGFLVSGLPQPVSPPSHQAVQGNSWSFLYKLNCPQVDVFIRNGSGKEEQGTQKQELLALIKILLKHSGIFFFKIILDLQNFKNILHFGVCCCLTLKNVVLRYFSFFSSNSDIHL